MLFRNMEINTKIIIKELSLGNKKWESESEVCGNEYYKTVHC